MQKMLIAFMATVSLAAPGCKKKSADGGDMMAKMTDLKNKMCECKAGDRACAEKVNEDMRKWGEQNSKGGHTTNPEMAKKMEPVTREFGECMMKAMAPAGGGDPMGASGSAMGSDHTGHGSGAGSDHAAMGHGSGSAMGSDHAAMGHGSGSSMGSDHSAHGSGSASGSAAGSAHGGH